MERRRQIALGVMVLEILVVTAVIARVPYTKIDWDAYMSQVSGFLEGNRNYAELEGDTGPLVYPAGFLYIYSGIAYLTKGAVFPAQVVFGILYIVNLSIVLLIYYRTRVVPWWTFVLLCLSKRVHSIFVLRLFNDCVASTLAHASIALFQSRHWYAGLIVFSLGVSVKMNVLLYAPPLLLLLLKALPLGGVLLALSLAAIVQVLLGLPFLSSYPLAYMSKAFDLGRKFIHFWSVNFKFVPEAVFLSRPFAILLLIIHLSLLFVFAQYKWCRHETGIMKATGLTRKIESDEDNSGKKKKMHQLAPKDTIWSITERQYLLPEHVVTVLFTGNYIGVVCARSLHYQFYSWYFHSLPFLLWKTPYAMALKLLLFAVIEVCWNIYPSNSFSSLALLICHLVLVWGLWCAAPEKPYTSQNIPKKAT